jgi:hypothetical protein
MPSMRASQGPKLVNHSSTVPTSHPSYSHHHMPENATEAASRPQQLLCHKPALHARQTSHAHAPNQCIAFHLRAAPAVISHSIICLGAWLRARGIFFLYENSGLHVLVLPLSVQVSSTSTRIGMQQRSTRCRRTISRVSSCAYALDLG